MNSTKPIVLVFGNLCSGKGHYCQTQYANRYHIATSDVVRVVSGATTRSELHKTADLDQEIAKGIITRIEQHGGNAIVDGIRQLSIIKAIIDYYGSGSVELIWLEVPAHVRKQRYTARGDSKDNQEFEVASDKDNVLGLGDVEQWVKKDPETRIVHYN